MDGVLYTAATPIPGAAETIAWVRQRAIPYRFVTNTSSRPRRALVDKLARFSIPATEAEIFTPAAVAAHWLRTHAEGPCALFVRPPARTDFAGIPCVADDAEHGASYVVMGDLGHLWDYRTLNRAFRLLHHNPKARLIALGMTRYWLAPDGISLDAAPFVAALENATGRKPLVFGKPAAAFFHAAADSMGLDRREVWMIGDDLEADIGGAQAAGLKAALVKTGKFRPLDLEGSITPDVTLDSIAALPAWFS